MKMKLSRCNAIAALICLFSVVAFAFFRSHESRIPPDTRVDYYSNGWFRDCIHWDPLQQRFLVSFIEGGLGQVKIREGDVGITKEEILVKDADLKGNATLGFKLDDARQRVVAVVADVFGHKYSALAAYDTRSWERIFLVKLAGAERPSLADDVALDPEGNAYVTDTLGNQIWKVGSDGSEVSILTASPIFSVQAKGLPSMFSPSLNGIAYHPDGFLLVVHTSSSALFKVSLDGNSVTQVHVEPVLSGDGIALVTPEQLAVAGLITGVRLVESKDGWLTARVTHLYDGPKHRLATSVTLKEGRVFVGYANGFGLPYLSTIGEAAFKPVNATYG